MSMVSKSQQGRRALVMTSQFKKDLKRARKRGLPIGELEAVVDMILEGADLPPKHHDHLLSGDYAGFRECHIQPDWLLIYLDEPELCVVTAIRTGSHSDLFQYPPCKSRESRLSNRHDRVHLLYPGCLLECGHDL